MIKYLRDFLNRFLPECTIYRFNNGITLVINSNGTYYTRGPWHVTSIIHDNLWSKDKAIKEGYNITPMKVNVPVSGRWNLVNN